MGRGSDSYLNIGKSVFLNSFVCQSITTSDQCLSGWKGTILIKMSTAVQKYNFRVNRWQELKLISRIGSPRGHPLLELSPYIASNIGECVRGLRDKGGRTGRFKTAPRPDTPCLYWAVASLITLLSCLFYLFRTYLPPALSVRWNKYQVQAPAPCLSTAESLLLRFEERAALWAVLTC